ncbi:MAG: 5-deoxy-glucuronate isomerase [Christensenellales bacterium]|jgi:5-deoxy-glucuronate isomerase
MANLPREKMFGHAAYDENGVAKIVDRENLFPNMLMDVTMYKMKRGEARTFFSDEDETAVDLIMGDVEFAWEGKRETARREHWLNKRAYVLHVPRGVEVTVTSQKDDTVILVQKTENSRVFDSVFYKPDDYTLTHFGVDLCGNTALRDTTTFFDYNTAPYSNMVMGEVFPKQGNWSGYPPHNHEQPELYIYLMDKPQGFGAAFIDDDVFKIKHMTFSAIPGGAMHPQVTAPGYHMCTIWMIRHLDDNPWNSRNDDPDHAWLYDAKFDD